MPGSRIIGSLVPALASLQQLLTTVVYSLMDESNKLWLVICFVGMAACASTESADHQREPDVEDIARALGCKSEEVAVCIDVDCKPEEFYCADRNDIREMLGAGGTRH